MRVAIMLCRVLACRGLSCDPSHPLVLAICQDVLHLGGPSNRAAGRRAAAAAGSPSAAVDLEQVLDEVWGAARAAEPPSEGPHGGPAGQRACPAHASPEWDEVLV
jgi:hypothetical protein